MPLAAVISSKMTSWRWATLTPHLLSYPLAALFESGSTLRRGRTTQPLLYRPDPAKRNVLFRFRLIRYLRRWIAVDRARIGRNMNT